MKRRLLSLAVLVILVFCMVPTALAEETIEDFISALREAQAELVK